jgi:hypothetical protein
MRRTAIFALLVAVYLALFGPVVSRGQQGKAFDGASTTVNLVAQMPSSAHVAVWVYHVPRAWIDASRSADLVVIGERWLLARGESLDARCAFAGADEQTGELVSLRLDLGAARGFAAFEEKSHTRTIPLVSGFNPGTGQQSEVRTVLAAHLASPANAAILRIVVVAF